MHGLLFALSVHSLISSVGADAGFAAIVGLAILVLLYFAHARETSVLREQAATLAQRLEEAESRLALAQREGLGPLATQSAPVPPPAATAHPGPAAVAKLPPAAPAGVGAPALAAATRVVPVGVQPAVVAAAPAPAVQSQPVTPSVQTESPRPPVPVQPPPAAPVGMPGSGGQIAAARISAPAAAPKPAQPATSTIPAPATAAALASAGAAASAGEPAAADKGTASAAANGGVAQQAPPDSGQPPARGPLPRFAGGSSASAASRPWAPLEYRVTRRAPWRHRAAVVPAGLLVVAGIAALIIATSGSGTQTKSQSARTSNLPAATRPGGFSPATVTVAVLNGTDVFHLAHRIALRLSADGYKQGPVTTAADQTQSATVVAYLPGHRSDAVHVADTLKLRASAVQPVNQSAEQVACPGPGACAAEVIVTVGSDLASS